MLRTYTWEVLVGIHREASIETLGTGGTEIKTAVSWEQNTALYRVIQREIWGIKQRFCLK